MQWSHPQNFYIFDKNIGTDWLNYPPGLAPHNKRDEHVSIWVIFLTSSDLHYFPVLAKSNKCGVKYYSQFFLVRQVGLQHLLPLPKHSTLNSSLMGQIIFDSLDLVKEISKHVRKLIVKTVIVFYEPFFDACPLFTWWWDFYIVDVVDEHFTKFISTLTGTRHPFRRLKER